MKNIESRIVSKTRVSDHGEVLTGYREVNSMLDLVAHETDRIESRFLEPACGDGNFLAEILKRKLNIVHQRYKTSLIEYKRYSFLAISSIYGIDIIEENTVKCRERLYEIFKEYFNLSFNDIADEEYTKLIKYILTKNIIWGDALSLKTVGKYANPIVFSEWSIIEKGKVKRRDFTFQGLMEHAAIAEMPLFSDLGENVFIPIPEKEYAAKHILNLVDDK